MAIKLGKFTLSTKAPKVPKNNPPATNPASYKTSTKISNTSNSSFLKGIGRAIKV